MINRRRFIVPGIIIALIVVLINCSDVEPHVYGRFKYCGLWRGDVNFPHDLHYAWGIGCLDCHHRFENGKNTLVYNDLLNGKYNAKCSSCHNSSRKLESAYHRMCITCHESMKKNRISSGPVSCGRCHSTGGM